jgi:hypothetical protein
MPSLSVSIQLLMKSESQLFNLYSIIKIHFAFNRMQMVVNQMMKLVNP